eukprot:scaffold6519_cov156-Ochromonas_danica.AAC.2
MVAPTKANKKRNPKLAKGGVRATGRARKKSIARYGTMEIAKREEARSGEASEEPATDQASVEAKSCKDNPREVPL